jgi:formylglycine-generating enzyme required for sulfatase activity
MIGCWSESRARRFGAPQRFTRARARSVILPALLLACACRDDAARASPAVTAAPALEAAPPWEESNKAPPAPLGMVWIPPGPLLAGTPPSNFPRLADQEPPGEQVMLDGYFIDVFAYPNEEGAIPETGVSQPEAARLCGERGKRLCSELEWERACKGPRNLTYEYGYRYRSEPCLTGESSRMLPSGYRFGCKSEFGTRDMHGGVWEWTSDRWGRGSRAELYAQRGGNSLDGELTGRCANARSRAPASSAADVGFRCCKGEPNSAVVNLRFAGRPSLVARGKPEPALAEVLESLVPEPARLALSEYGDFRVSEYWHWRPIGNELLTAGIGCASSKSASRCGVIVARLEPGNNEALAWVDAGRFPPGLRIYDDARKLYVYGADRVSSLRQRVVFEWGRLRLADFERKLGANPTWKPTSVPCCR